MCMLIIASCIHWGQSGVGQLTDNWKLGRTQNSNAFGVAKQLFYGVCVGMLGLTGFECEVVPSFLSYSGSRNVDRHTILCIPYQTRRVSAGFAEPPYLSHPPQFNTYDTRLGACTFGCHPGRCQRSQCPC